MVEGNYQANSDDNQKFMATCKIRYWYGPNWNEDIDEYKEVVDLINKRDHLVLKEFSHILRVQMNLEIL